MTRTQHKLGLLVAAAVALAAVVMTGGAAAQLTDANVTVDDPGNQTVAVDVSFSGSTDATAELTKDGSVVESSTVSGSSGTTETLTLDPTGLQAGDYGLSVSATDETVTTLEDTRLVTTRNTALNLSQNDTVLVDVEFDAAETTTATVNLTNSGTLVNSTTLSFDPVDFADGSGMKTAEFSLDSDYSALNASVDTSPASGHSQVWVSADDDSDGLLGGAGVVAGASQEQLLGFGAVVVVLVAFYNRDYL